MNVAICWSVALVTQRLVFPVIGLQVSLSQNLTLSSVFTGISLLRSYGLRRLFERAGRPRCASGTKKTEGRPRMGRPPITLTAAQFHEVETLAALLSQEQIADYFGIARNTSRAIRERDEEVAARYKRGKAIAHVANGLLQKARSGETASSIFYLKTQAGWRETAVMEHAGPEGGPIRVGDGRARLLSLISRIAARQTDAGQGTDRKPVPALSEGG